MLAVFLAVLAASLLGSMHCAGMCGAFLAFAIAPLGPESDEQATTLGPALRRRAALQAWYHAGRLVTYLALGAAAGTLGSAVDLGGSAIGLQRAAAFTAGALMVVIGTLALLHHMGVRKGRVPVPPMLATLVRRAHVLADRFPAPMRALVIGLSTTLLPCGWLYAFVITSAGTGHPAVAMLVMLAFWIGTLPVMVALGSGFQAAFGPLRRHLPVLTSLLVVVVGVLSLMQRSGPVDITRIRNAMHETTGDESDGGLTIEHVERATTVELPCCDD